MVSTTLAAWPAVSYEQWPDTCNTLHAHTQVLGKLAAELAPPEPELQHTALRLTARGWETAALPAPDGSGYQGAANWKRAQDGGQTGYCAGGVETAISWANLGSVSGDAGPAEVQSLSQDSNFKNITQDVKPQDIPNLPAGCVVVMWDNSGHIHSFISDGNGQESSDWAGQISNSDPVYPLVAKGQAQYQVFVPV